MAHMPNDPRGSIFERATAKDAIKGLEEYYRNISPAAYPAVRKRMLTVMPPILNTLSYSEWGTRFNREWQLCAGALAFGAGVEPVVTGHWKVKAPYDETNSLGLTDKELKTMKPIKVPKPPKKDYNTVGVRFVRGHNLHKVYTYKVAKKAKLRLGEEIVVPSVLEGYETNGIGVVVDLHKTPQDTQPGINYKFVTGRVALL